MLETLVRRQGLLIVISGPSGVGKDTVIDRLIDANAGLVRAVTATTRAPRPAERNGVDYHFLDTATFEQKVGAGEFLEYAQVHGNLYGTVRSEVDKLTGAGYDVILKIDVQGGINVRKTCPDSILVFVMPPSAEELENRLRNRKTDNEQSIVTRLENARQEMQTARSYDYVVVNNRAEQAVSDIEAIIIAEHHRVYNR